jgi:hypothetical protein
MGTRIIDPAVPPLSGRGAGVQAFVLVAKVSDRKAFDFSSSLGGQDFSSR